MHQASIVRLSIASFIAMVSVAALLAATQLTVVTPGKADDAAHSALGPTDFRDLKPRPGIADADGQTAISSSSPESCNGDLTGSGTVNVDDLLMVLNNWNSCPGGNPGCPGDATKDGEVNVDDLLVVLNNWGSCPTGACCLAGGGCSEVSAVDCANVEGEFHGEGTGCDDGLCVAGPDCPGGAIEEDEPCGASTNDGCNLSTPAFGPALACGATVCGTSWADGGNRDTDWYPITLTEPTKITWTVEAAFPVQVFIVNHACDDELYIHATASGADQATAEACLPPGDYRLIAAVNATDGYPCGSVSDYVGTVSCESCVPQGQSCSDPIPVPVDGGIVTTSTVSRDVADIPDCLGFDEGIPNSPTVWFEIQGTGTELTVSTCGPSSLSTKVSVLCNVCDDLSCVASNNDFNFMCSSTPFAPQVTFCSELGITYYVAVWGEGAGSAGNVSLKVTSGNSCSDPDGNCEGQCAGFCGDQAPSGCACDPWVCENFPDLCCPGFCGDCPDLCEPDDPDDCEFPGCSDTVGEPCGQDIYGGCNMANPQFADITCGEAVCGTLWAQNGSRDTDWFEFTLTESRVVTWSVESEVPVNAVITNGECGGEFEQITFDSGCTASTSVCLQPGTYHLVVTPVDTNGHPCPGFNYEATLTCTAHPNCEEPSCSGNCGGGFPAGCTENDCQCWCDEFCNLLGDCCDDVCAECPELDFCG